mgnify:CR=1 FL=1
MAVTNNMIQRFRGDTYPLIVTLKENGSAVDLTTATVRMTIGLDTPSTITATATNAAGGEVRFDFTQTEVGTAGRFSYDIEVTDGSIVTTYVKDIFELIEDVTT